MYEYEKWGEHSDYTECEWICVINWSHENYEGIKWRWKYMMLKNGMLKHSVMTLDEKRCDNIWGGNKFSKMNRWRTMLWHWMLMSKCDNTCCNAI